MSPAWVFGLLKMDRPPDTNEPVLAKLWRDAEDLSDRGAKRGIARSPDSSLNGSHCAKAGWLCVPGQPTAVAKPPGTS